MVELSKKLPAQQVPFDVTDFADNPEPRCPCILLLDVSRSMRDDDKIRHLNQGVRDFRAELLEDELAAKRVELAIVTMGGRVRVQADFQTVDYFNPFELEADGGTPLGEAVEAGIDLVEARKEVYRRNGVPYYRPWIMLLTDGDPTDEWQVAAERVHKGEQAKSFLFFPVAVGPAANMDILRTLSVREPVRLRGLEFRSMFRWLSNSLRTTSHSRVGDVVALESPVGPRGWATTE